MTDTTEWFLVARWRTLVQKDLILHKTVRKKLSEYKSRNTKP